MQRWRRSSEARRPRSSSCACIKAPVLHAAYSAPLLADVVQALQLEQIHFILHIPNVGPRCRCG